MRRGAGPASRAQQIQQLIRWSTNRSRPLGIGKQRVILQSSVLNMRLPWGRYVWQRPTAVVERHGRQVTLPIRDVTMTLGGILFMLLRRVRWTKKRA